MAKKLRHKDAPPLGRPRSLIPKENAAKMKTYIESLFDVIDSKGELVDYYVARKMGVGYKTVRLWYTRGIPLRLRERFAMMAGVSARELDAAHQDLVDG